MCIRDSFEPIVTNKTPGDGEDLLLSSANNLYDGVSLRDLEDFEERYPLNSRLVKREGRLIKRSTVSTVCTGSNYPM